MTVFFTADTHFDHANIIKYTNRPFSNVDEMNEILIQNWNSVVDIRSEVYHLGDFGFGDEDKLRRIAGRLNGYIHFIEGNHDRTTRKIKSAFVDYYPPYREISLNGKSITLCHYSMRVWNKSHRGAWHLYGHSHGTLPDDPNSLSIDVGVDCHNYTPISFEEISKIMSKKTFKPIDHHGENR